MSDRLSQRRLVFVVVAIPLTLYLSWQAALALAAIRHARPYDGQVDWLAARAWWQGIDAWSAPALQQLDLVALGHPPTTAFWFLPLAPLSPTQMSLVIGLATAALLLAALWMVAVELHLPLPPLTALLTTALLLQTGFMRYHFRLAQLSGAIAALYIFAWRDLRRGRDGRAGVALGLACTLKLFPGAVVLALLLVRRLRAVAGAVAAWLVVNAVVLARYGLLAWPDFFRGNDLLMRQWVGSLHNVSLFGIVLRVFYPICGRVTGDVTRPFLLTIALAAAIFVAALLLARRALAQPATCDLPFALFTVLSYFLNPWVWEHYAVLLVFPLLLAATVAWRTQALGPALLLPPAAVVVCWLPLDAVRDLVRALPAQHVELHVVHTLSLLPAPLVMASLAWLLVREQRAQRAP